MKEVGQKLREARLSKGLSIDDLATLTKIRASYLKAIEEGDLTKIPGSVYAKGFIKVYAGAVGLDPNQILREYQVEPVTPQPLPEAREIKGVKSNKSQNTRKIVVTVLVVGIVLAVAFFGVYVFYTLKNETLPQLREPEPNVTEDEQKTEENTTIDPAAENQVPADGTTGTVPTDGTTTPDAGTTEPGQEPGTTNPATTPTTQSQGTTTPTNTTNTGTGAVQTPITTPQPTGNVIPSQSTAVPVTATPVNAVPANSVKKIQIIANEYTWLRVKVDDQIVFSDYMNSGETKTYEGKTIHLRIGNAAAVQVKYNNELMGPFGAKDQVIDRTF